MTNSVHLFTNNTTREFSVSRRADDNHDVEEIADMEAELGFEFSTIARGMPRYDADAMKTAIIKVMEAAGYTMKNREQIKDYRARTGGRAPKRA